MSPRWPRTSSVAAGRRSVPNAALGALVVLLVACGGDDATPASRLPSPTVAVDLPPAATGRPPAGETWGARVTDAIALRSRPSLAAPVVARHGRRTEFGSPRVLAVVRIRGPWLGVKSEKLGNADVGWVRHDDIELLREQWSIEVDLSERRATLLRKGRPFFSFSVGVGAPGTDTPPGRYGVTDRLTTGGAGSPYGCCVLALSGRQPNVPQDWPGGDRLAIHGTSAPASIGRAASSGCLRADEASMRLLIRRVPLGSQVRVRP